MTLLPWATVPITHTQQNLANAGRCIFRCNYSSTSVGRTSKKDEKKARSYLLKVGMRFLYIYARRCGAVGPGQHHYLCRWALGIRTRESLSMLARPVHRVTPRPRSIGHNLACFRILPCRTSMPWGRQGCICGAVGGNRPRSLAVLPSFLLVLAHSCSAYTLGPCSLHQRDFTSISVSYNIYAQRYSKLKSALVRSPGHPPPRWRCCV